MAMRFVRFELPCIPSREAPTWRQEVCLNSLELSFVTLQEAEVFERLALDQVFKKDQKHRWVHEDVRIRPVCSQQICAICPRLVPGHLDVRNGSWTRTMKAAASI